MIRLAKAGDEPVIEAFLRRHAETSMFLRSNLLNLGLGQSASPRSTDFWLVEGARLEGVVGYSKAGFVLCQMPTATLKDWQAIAQGLKGRPIGGIMGPAEQVVLGKRGLGADAAHFSTDREEPLYRLSLNQMISPEITGNLRPAVDGDLDLLINWIIDYDMTAFGLERTDDVRKRAVETAKAHIGSDMHRILEVDGAPVAKTAFNATLPDMVQIGGVYTPPELRSQGFARQAVALHLQEAQASGVGSAILFASGPPACRAYEAIGFEHIGSYHLAILKEPLTVGEA